MFAINYTTKWFAYSEKFLNESPLPQKYIGYFIDLNLSDTNETNISNWA